jgi:hypothetical protein
VCQTHGCRRAAPAITARALGPARHAPS